MMNEHSEDSENKPSSSSISSDATSIEDVIITGQLQQRCARQPNYQIEAEALARMALELANSPHTLIQHLVDTALLLCGADSAGVSILESHEEPAVFRWHALAGTLTPFLNATTPHNFSPCGIVLDRNAPQLLADPWRFFPHTKRYNIAELLLIPFYRDKVMIGAIWVVSHSRAKQFDREDARLVESLSRFVSAAMSVISYAQATEATRRELSDIRSRMSAALEAGAIATWVWNIVTDEVFADANLANLFKVSPGDAVGGPLARYLQAVHPDDYPAVIAAIYQAVEDCDTFQQEYRVVQTDGSLRWVEARGSVELDLHGRPSRMVGVIVDVTDRKQTQEALAAGELRLRTALTAGKMGTWELNILTNVLTCSDSCKANYGRTGEQAFAYEDVVASVHPEDLEDWQKTVQRSIETGDELTTNYRTIWPDGSVHWVHVRGACLTDGTGKVTMMSGISIDITDRKQMDEDLTQQAEKLRENDRRKDEFLATLAHELRNPLAPIRNMLEVMMHTNNDPESLTRSRDVMDRQLAQMVRLIDDLLDTSRISRGKLELKRIHCQYLPLLQQEIDVCRPTAEKAQLDLRVSLPTEAMFIHADPVRVAQIFGNLLNNACKYTPAGGMIELTARREGKEVVVSIRDNGVGLPPEMLQSVFEMFTQVDQSLERSQGGLGIGLMLVRRLVELHGGTVQAESQGLGKGSTFTVRLPLVEEPMASPTPTPTNSASGSAPRKILVVDDNRDSANTLALLMKLSGSQTATAYDGLEAVEVSQSFQPDVILLDLGLPNMNGFDACRTIRQRDGGEAVKIIALTGWGQEDDRRKTKEAGFDGHLVKPVELAALKQLLGELCTSQA